MSIALIVTGGYSTGVNLTTTIKDVVLRGYSISEDKDPVWDDIPPVSSTWNAISADSSTWTDITGDNSTWTDI